MTADFIAMLQSALEKSSPVMTGTITKIEGMKLQNWHKHFSETLSRLFPDQTSMHKAAEAYTRFALEVTMHQHRFNGSGKYLCTSYEEVARNVYHDNEYMSMYYLPGVLLSHYLWVHHYKEQLYFQKKFLPLLVSCKDPQFCEVGLGTGLYSRMALSISSKIKGWGYDISKAAVEFSEYHMRSFSVDHNWKGEVRNIEKLLPEIKFSHAICVEVLEHLEDPVKFLCCLREYLSPAGKAFVAAAVTAAEFDHIYLYRSAEEVRAHLISSGFKVMMEKEFVAPGFSCFKYVPKLAAFIVERY